MTPDREATMLEVERHPTARLIAETISSRIAETRAIRGFSLDDVASRAGLSKGHIWELEKGRSANPTLDTAVRIARALGVSVDYLTGMTTDTPSLHPEALRIACDVDRLLRTLQPDEPSDD